MGKTGNFVVDTKNLCFLCFRPAKIIAAGVKRRVKDKTFSLRSLSRYMNVDFQNMARGRGSQAPLSSSLGNSQQEGGSNGKFPQVLVTVCSRCSAVTEEFENLYQYLEFTQMKINACVRNMNELMKKTDGNARLVDKFRKKMKTLTLPDSDEGQVLENIRKSIMENCSSVLRNAFPRVKLTRSDEKVQNKRTILKLTAGAKPSPRCKKPKFSSTILKKSPPLSIVNESVPLEGGNSAQTPSQETSEKGGVFQCLHCDNTFSDTGGLRIHIVRYHREQFFSMFKISTISEEDFKIAVELLFQDVRKITANSGAQSTVSYVCSCCGKPFAAQIDTYVHMVQLHHDVLSNKLQNIQKNTSLIASAKTKVQLPNVSNLRIRRKRGPYKKRNAATGSSGPSNTALDYNFKNQSTLIRSKKKRTFKQNPLVNPTSINELEMNTDKKFPKTCKCGVQLSSKSSWHNHQTRHCKLIFTSAEQQPKVKVFQTAKVQHPSLKRAKNTLGFPRTCECGVRLSMRTSWNNHQKFHCKLKFGKKSDAKAGSVTLNLQGQNAVKRGERKKTAMMKKYGKGPRNVELLLENEETNVQKNRKYECECGVSCSSYTTWYYHKTKSCKLRVSDESYSIDLDIVEEIPIEITSSGDLCLPSTSTSIDISPVPKIMKVSSAGGVIKGLQSFANFQVKKEVETKSSAAVLDTGSYSDLFSKYLPFEISKEEIATSLKKVLEEYRKFPGSISGCPYCGRGFTQVPELQSHMVEGHFEEVLSKLKNLIDPSGMAQCSYDGGGTINVDPGLVKTENLIEIDASTNNDICTMGSPYSQQQDFQPNYLEEQNDIGNAVVAKDEIEITSYPSDETAMNDGGDDDQLLILP